MWVMRMEKKSAALQAFLLVLLVIALATLGMAVYSLWKEGQRRTPYANARYVRNETREVQTWSGTICHSTR